MYKVIINFEANVKRLISCNCNRIKITFFFPTERRSLQNIFQVELVRSNLKREVSILTISRARACFNRSQLCTQQPASRVFACIVCASYNQHLREENWSRGRTSPRGRAGWGGVGGLDHGSLLALSSTRWIDFYVSRISSNNTKTNSTFTVFSPRLPPPPQHFSTMDSTENSNWCFL